ncbi:MAG: hypothetical protein IPI58_09700 [Alphaproteobacteria bacterium]|nr:MAG: hypothetical protein IPI58_09700 [Alphaproteobacteria bacterium]
MIRTHDSLGGGEVLDISAQGVLISSLAGNRACHEFFALPAPAPATKDDITDAMADVAVRVKLRRD